MEVQAKTMQPANQVYDAADDAPPAILDLADKIRKIHAEGKPLPAERVLAERLDVARHTLRRALQYLRDRDEIPPARPRSRRGGAKARPDDLVGSTNPMEIAELRRMMEPFFARLAALRATPSDIAAMQKELERDARGEKNDLHNLIARAAGNSLAAEIFAILRHVESDARLGISTERAQSGESLERKRALVDAIAARSPDRAGEAMAATLAAIYRQSLFDLD